MIWILVINVQLIIAIYAYFFLCYFKFDWFFKIKANSIIFNLISDVNVKKVRISAKIPAKYLDIFIAIAVY